MKYTLLSLGALTPFVWACGASVPPPTQRMADAQAAERSARELGAESEPTAQLSLKLAQDQIELAKKAMNRDDNEQAGSLLLRAKADAELALAQAREKAARADWQAAIDASTTQKTTNAGQGAVQ